MRTTLQGIPALSIFVFAMLADGLMDTYGPGKFMIIALVWSAICAVIIGLSYLFEDHFYDGRRWKR